MTDRAARIVGWAARRALRWSIPRPRSPTAPACKAVRRVKTGCWKAVEAGRFMSLPLDGEQRAGTFYPKGNNRLPFRQRNFPPDRYQPDAPARDVVALAWAFRSCAHKKKNGHEKHKKSQKGKQELKNQSG